MYLTPGISPQINHSELCKKLDTVACGVIIGLSKSPDMHPAQYLFSKQWSEREQLILDELWIVLEEKLKLRKQLLDARQTVSDKLNAIDECERRQEDSDKILRWVLTFDDHRFKDRLETRRFVLRRKAS